MTIRQDFVHPKSVAPKHILEAPRQTPIRSDVDVLVCGGGPAGTAAALAAARSGAKTLLVERYGMLGGIWTAGLLNPFFECIGRGWITQEIIDRLKARNAFRDWFFSHTFDTESMKLVLEEMMAEAGVQLLYHSFIADAIVENGVIRGAIIESKAGREAITAKVIIDATGDGDIAARAGCQYEFGRPEDGLLQPMTLMYEIRGIGNWEMRDSRPLYDAMAQAIKDHNIDFQLPFLRAKYVPWIINTPKPGHAAVQLAHVYRLNSLNPSDLTKGTIECRRQIHKAVEVLKKLPGLENMELVQTAPQIGVREGRRIKGHHWLTYEELADGCTFKDAIASCGFVVDIHEPDMTPETKPAPLKKIQPYEIPFRCLIPLHVKNLLTAGRCISGSTEAHASYRQTGTASAMGQAAGLAAAWSAQDNTPLLNLPGERLKSTLAARGAQFLDSIKQMSVPEDEEIEARYKIEP